jgi:transposase
VNANQVFGWRRLYQRGLLGGNAPSVALVPVKITENAVAPALPDPAVAATPTGSIQLRLPKGQLRIDGAVDAVLLRVLVECRLR